MIKPKLSKGFKFSAMSLFFSREVSFEPKASFEFAIFVYTQILLSVILIFINCCAFETKCQGVLVITVTSQQEALLKPFCVEFAGAGTGFHRPFQFSGKRACLVLFVLNWPASL